MGVRGWTMNVAETGISAQISLIKYTHQKEQLSKVHPKSVMSIFTAEQKELTLSMAWSGQKYQPINNLARGLFLNPPKFLTKTQI